ncbi:AcrR family transcriptional regulator [Actinoplanes lutulentus]|uniref:TetR family transcriptional regulator n=1 Tax=Actinoplanes lutulentus TaxID=1287878 RepID=A0A327Z287_9ACTN|nr:TetR/AcrR family transcriptional regulator [Actinoplanes lutulentus]MBB2940376.1 AcrR family transcriptional regulator [Actinoplanes lutulentus]RAK28868.1 TetR family transcriptional regulator [Actinoplanes lutulentus]
MGRTKEEILLAAERMFAGQGFEVSLREIGAAAGQRNHSAVQYHFGDKAGLVKALYEYRMVPLNAHRRTLLDDLHATGSSGDLPSIVRVWLTPLADHVVSRRGHSWYVRFISRFVLSGSYQEMPFSGDYFAPMIEVFGLLARRLPNLTEERLRTTNLHTVIVLADLEQRLDDPDFTESEATAVVDELLLTTLAVLNA